MPPLLPEYLSQPLQSFTIHIQEPTQVAVQSLPTDWWALISAGLFTLAGAAAGAWYGGRAAYQNTVKAQNDFVKRKKLEEALSIVLKIEDCMRAVNPSSLRDFHAEFINTQNIKKAQILSAFDINDVARLRALLQIYDQSLVDKLADMDSYFHALETWVSTGTIIDRANLTLPHGSIKSAQVFTELKNELIAKLQF